MQFVTDIVAFDLKCTGIYLCFKIQICKLELANLFASVWPEIVVTVAVSDSDILI